MSEKWGNRLWYGTMGTLFVISAAGLIVTLLLGVPVLWMELQNTYGGG